MHQKETTTQPSRIKFHPSFPSADFVTEDGVHLFNTSRNEAACILHCYHYYHDHYEEW